MCILNIVGWLVTHWSTLTSGAEIKEDAVVSFGYNVAPHFAHGKIQELLDVSNFFHAINMHSYSYHGLCLLAGYIISYSFKAKCVVICSNII